MPSMPKRFRLTEFIRQLQALPRSSNHSEARGQIAETLNKVEDEYSGVPFDPAHWRTDGRMYPFEEDSATDVDGFPEVTAYRSRGHETFIAKNGAFEIHDLGSGEIVIEKSGSDGRRVWS
jgi:hypothetical protein